MTMQPFEQLERDFGVWLGNPHCVAVSSGTSALHLALETFNLLRYQKVIVPDFTMVACPRAVVMAGLSPTFIDCGNDLLIRPDLVHEAVGNNSSIIAIMAVHVYGRICDMEALHDVPEGVFVIEDMAEAHGVFPHQDTDAACWSFYKNKIVYGEEGGMIAFKQKRHADAAKELRSLGFDSQHNFSHRPRGVNARMSNLHATPILDSFHNMSANLYSRARIADMYNTLLPPEYLMPPRTVNWVHDIRIPGMNYSQQTNIVTALNNQGIAARHAFKPMTSQMEFIQATDNVNAHRLSQEIIYLPITEHMTGKTVMVNVAALLAAINSERK